MILLDRDYNEEDQEKIVSWFRDNIVVSDTKHITAKAIVAVFLKASKQALSTDIVDEIMETIAYKALKYNKEYNKYAIEFKPVVYSLRLTGYERKLKPKHAYKRGVWHRFFMTAEQKRWLLKRIDKADKNVIFDKGLEVALTKEIPVVKLDKLKNSSCNITSIAVKATQEQKSIIRAIAKEKQISIAAFSYSVMLEGLRRA